MEGQALPPAQAAQPSQCLGCRPGTSERHVLVEKLKLGKGKSPAPVTEGLASAHHWPRLGEEGCKRWFSKGSITQSKGHYPKTSRAAQEQQERTGEALPQPCHQAQGAHKRLQPHTKRAPREVPVSDSSFSTSVLQCPSPHGAQTVREEQQLPLPGWGFSAPPSPKATSRGSHAAAAVCPVPGLSAVPNNHTDHSREAGGEIKILQYFP